MSRPSSLILEAFERSALRAPAADAVRCGGRATSYTQLRADVVELAEMLGDVHEGRPVALELTPGPTVVAAMLACLGIGVPFVPIDPRNPKERRDLLLANSGATAVLSDLGGTLALEAIPAVKEEIDPTRLVPSHLPGDRLAYLILTSGSTGVPKGAAVWLKPYENLIRWFRRAVSCTPDDRTLIVSSLSFDLTLKNVFMPLVVGATIVFPDEPWFDPEEIATLIEEERITWINCAPSALYLILEESSAPRDFSSLRHVILGGEPINGGRINEKADDFGFRAQLWNTYGPTECTDVVTWYVSPSVREVGAEGLPIGAAIDKAKLLVVDSKRNVLVGEASGELVIGGLPLGAGYPFAPSSTEQRFSHLAAAGDSGRFYFTGDIVNRRPDGMLEFVSRVDNQVKVNGYRFELGDVEHALRAADDVRDAVVVSSRPDEWSTEVVAFVLAGEELNLETLRSRLGRRLPAYMIPSWLVQVDDFPVMPSGKVDRVKLKSDAAQIATGGPASSRAAATRELGS